MPGYVRLSGIAFACRGVMSQNQNQSNQDIIDQVKGQKHADASTPDGQPATKESARPDIASHDQETRKVANLQEKASPTKPQVVQGQNVNRP